MSIRASCTGSRRRRSPPSSWAAAFFAAAADWALYQLGLARVVAKCFKENAASHRMLASCMRPGGEDETYFYFEKVV